MSATQFKLIKTQDKDTQDDYIAEPILASFPNNIPPPEVLTNLNFTISQQADQSKKKRRKRVIKAETKGIRYVAKSFQNEVNPKDQASDYYVGVFDQSENKVYMIPVSTTYQFNQEIEGFKETYGQSEDNEAMKGMSFMDQKLRLVSAFGTKKALKKVTSLVNNMVDETGITNQSNKGVRDQRLQERAQHIEEEQAHLQKDLLTQSGRRKTVYTKDALLPQVLLSEIPYKYTEEALKNEDSDSLKKFIHSYFVQNILKQSYISLQNLPNKKELKSILKSYIYLDCLIAFYRMPQQINESPEDLSHKLKLPVSIVEHILTEFTEISLKNQSRVGKQEETDHEFKYVKSKENIKKLICHILAISALLNRGTQMKASELSKVLKKEVNELKSYFQEIGFHYTTVKGQDELLISLVPDKEDKEAAKKERQEQKKAKESKRKHEERSS